MWRVCFNHYNELCNINVSIGAQHPQPSWNKNDFSQREKSAKVQNRLVAFVFVFEAKCHKDKFIARKPCGSPLDGYMWQRSQHLHINALPTTRIPWENRFENPVLCRGESMSHCLDTTKTL